MKIQIELDLEFYSDENEDFIHDYIADLTYNTRVDRRLRDWKISYDITEN